MTLKRSLTADVSRVRKNNLSRVLNLIRQRGSITRTTIVRETGLSATTVSALVNVVLASGFVREAGTGVSSGGRPPILLQFDPTFRHVLGVDVGATHLTVVVMDLGGEVVARRFCHFTVWQDPAGATTTINTLITEVMEEAGLTPATVLGMGVAVPAPLEGEHLDRLSGAILPAWDGYNLVTAVDCGRDLPLYVDNDANAGAIAERWWGHGKAIANLAYIKLGTGVGSGLIVQGEIYRGVGGTAGEIGHTTIDVNGPRCRCGKDGCLESFVGVPAILAEVEKRRAETVPAGALPAPAATIQEITANGDDPIHHAVIAKAGTQLGIAIANLLNLFNPELIVLGGELTDAGDVLLDAVRTSVQQRAMPKAAREARIVLSRLGADAVAIGAATIVIHHAFQPANISQTLVP